MMVGDRIVIRWVAFLAAIVMLGDAAWAVPPSVLRDYTFVPSRSSLGITGGFAGVNHDLTIEGSFGLVTDWSDENLQLTVDVYFIDVDATLSDPHVAAPLPGTDLDQLLNLTGLDGQVITLDSHYLFSGLEGQGWPMTVEVTTEDGGLRLVGSNDAGCCDFFNYELDAFALPTATGPTLDFNADGYIDILDFDILAANFGAPPSLAGLAGDTDGDGDVDMNDYTRLALAIMGGSTPPVEIPEPTGVAMLGVGMLALMRGRR